jgi:hypothetical protein
VIETGTFRTVAFAYWDIHTPTNALKLGITSSNPAVLPVANIKASPTSLLLAPLPGQIGDSTVSITVTNNDNLTATTTFLVSAVPSKGQVFSGPKVTIPTSGAATPYGSTNLVSGISGNITKVTVGLFGYSHTFPSDVSMLLVGPTGKAIVLLSRAGAGFSINNLFLTFDDAAANSVPQFAAMTDGVFKPTDYKPSDAYPGPAPVGPYGSTLSEFNGTDPNGAWSLFVYDEISPDSGAINSGWTLSITSSTGKTVVVGNAATPSLSLSKSAEGMVLSLSGAPGVEYTIQSTTDMTNWSDAGTVTADNNGKAEHTVAPSTSGAQFFRALAK